jgi:hypothetical protein
LDEEFETRWVIVLEPPAEQELESWRLGIRLLFELLEGRDGTD